MISDIISGDGDEDERFRRIEDLVEERKAAQSEYQEARQRRSEVERRIEELENRAEETRREAKTREILPSGEEGAAATALKSKEQERQEIEREKERLENEVKEAEERLDRAEAELEAALTELIPGVIAELEEHTRRHRAELMRFSEDVLNRLASVREKVEERAELIEKLDYLMDHLEGQDRRTNHARRHEVRQRIKSGLDERLRGEMLALEVLDAFRGITDEEDLEERPRRVTSDRVPLRTLD